MSRKGGISTLREWLIVLLSLVDDALVLALIFLGLWAFHVRITWQIILVVAACIVGFVLLMHWAVIPALRKKKITGSEGMIGMVGTVVKPLKPEGIIKIGGEYWQAKSLNGDINIGEEVEVIRLDGLILGVKRILS